MHSFKVPPPTILALCTKSSVTNIVTRIYFVISRKCNNARDKGLISTLISQKMIMAT